MIAAVCNATVVKLRINEINPAIVLALLTDVVSFVIALRGRVLISSAIRCRDRCSSPSQADQRAGSWPGREASEGPSPSPSRRTLRNIAYFERREQ